MKKALIVSIVLLLICIFFGCSKSDVDVKTEDVKTEVDNIAVLLGNHSNSKKFDQEDLDNVIESSCESLGSICFIVVDGTPSLEMDENANIAFFRSTKDILDLKKEYKNENYKNKDIKKRVKEINNAIKSFSSDSDEVDLQESFIKAISVINKNKNNEQISANINSKICVFDPGLSTLGTVNFVEYSILDKNKSEIDQYIEELLDDSNLPDFSGIKVEWYGCGNVAPPQEKLSHSEIDNLKYFWKKYITATHGEVNFFDEISETYNTYNYKVSVVPINHQNETITQLNVDNRYSEIQYNIYFTRNDYKYKNEHKAIKTINDVAITIKNSNCKWYILGFEAGKTNDEIDNLGNHISTKRAIKVKNDLIKEDVDYNQLIVCSLGPYSNWHTEDYVDNSWIEELAKENRKVIIICESNKEIQNNIDFISKTVI